MALPKIQLPKYEVLLPALNKNIWIRPFTVKEEKILLMAEEGSKTDRAVALLQIVENCVLSENIEIEKLPFFLVMYIFLNIKKISTTEEITIQIKEKLATGEEYKYDAYCNLNEDIVIENEDFLKDDKSNIIQITNNEIYLKIKPLLFKDYIKLMKIADKSENSGKKEEVDLIYNALLLTIKEIYDNTSSYDPEEYSMNELADFYNDISFKDKENIKKVYEKLPTIALKFHYTDKDGNPQEKIMDEMNPSFLA